MKCRKPNSLLILYVVIGCVWGGASLVAEDAPLAWMARVSDDTSVVRVNIPGTHDTCALHGLLAWGQCQTLTLDEQLKAGVRFLDIRCKLIEGELNIYHGIVDQETTFRAVVKSCRLFLSQNPSEVILMSIKDEASPDLEKGEFGSAIGKVIEDRPELWVQANSIPKLGDVRGRIVVVSRNREVAGMRWGKFKIQDAFRLEGRDAINTKWQKFVKQATAASASDRGGYINFSSGTGLFYPPKSVAKEMNPRLLKHFESKPIGYQGIVVMDFVSVNLVKAVVDSNFD